MKRIITPLIVAIMALLLCACGAESGKTISAPEIFLPEATTEAA